MRGTTARLPRHRSRGGADRRRPRRHRGQRYDEGGGPAPRRPRDARTARHGAVTASDLRSTLGRLLGEHAALAMNATNLGVTGSKSFPAAAKASTATRSSSRRRSARSTAPRPRRRFLDGKFQWRAHINFFVDYTVGDREEEQGGPEQGRRQPEDVHEEHGDFLAGATGLPKLAVQNDLLGHVLELKNQLDAYAAGDYTKAAEHLPRRLRPHVHDGRPARGRDREAEEPQVRLLRSRSDGGPFGACRRSQASSALSVDELEPVDVDETAVGELQRRDHREREEGERQERRRAASSRASSAASLQARLCATTTSSGWSESSPATGSGHSATHRAAVDRDDPAAELGETR